MRIKDFEYWHARSALSIAELAVHVEVSTKTISTLRAKKGQVSPRLANKVLLGLSQILREKGIRQELLELEDDTEPAFANVDSRIA